MVPLLCNALSMTKQQMLAVSLHSMRIWGCGLLSILWRHRGPLHIADSFTQYQTSRHAGHETSAAKYRDLRPEYADNAPSTGLQMPLNRPSVDGRKKASLSLRLFPPPSLFLASSGLRLQRFNIDPRLPEEGHTHSYLYGPYTHTRIRSRRLFAGVCGIIQPSPAQHIPFMPIRVHRT
jgi:hypothetical protein